MTLKRQWALDAQNETTKRDDKLRLSRVFRKEIRC
jgi:hypothetical protein